MISKIKIFPIYLTLSISCGESTAFKESELGRFEITVADGNAPVDNSGNSAVPLEQIISTPDDEAMVEGGTDTEAAYTKKVEAALAHSPFSDGSSGNGQGQESQAAQEGAGADSADSSSISDEQTMKLCSKLFQGKAKYIKLIRQSDYVTALQANSETVIAIRLSGNQPKFALAVGGSQKLAGLCIVATGNRPSTEISSSVGMGQIVYVARGNQSAAIFSFENAALDSAYVNLKGNSHKVAFNDVGAAVCDSLRLNQQNATVECN